MKRRLNIEGKSSVDLAQQWRKIIKDKNITQATMAEYADVSESQFSRVLSGSVQLSLRQLAMIASNLNMREIDIYTYPDRYVKAEQGELSNEPIEAVLQIKLQKSKKDQVLRLIFGDNDIELLNH